MADTVGNRLGERATFVYTTDGSEDVVFQQDRSVGLAVGNTLATTSTRPTSVTGRYLRGRYLLLQGKDDPNIKKKVVVGDIGNSLFAAEGSQEVTINGVVFVTTGKVGESVSFLRVSEGVPATP